ncbi:hypothetical protein FQN55_002600 [Onygenales sp. PD_40]|nr:hypothetical protein FQN55_002600 [Onygenales sp. PD_40]KAK2779786.1 hypothetical protein FQN52_002385 [Onygenales sp. PD_12]KAK2788866.1 hypothetical protein FQN53_003054 [Emmonsiellopsis sp. PD_33]
MKLATTLLAALTLVGYAHSHAVVYGVWVNGEDQGDGQGKYIRSPPSNDPVKDLSSPAVACNVNGSPVSEFVSAAAGDEIIVEWYHDSRGDDIIASSHKGPVQAYIAPYTEGNGADAGWTKIASQGYDSAQDRWAVDDLIANKGKLPFKLPSNLAPGKYLLRHEIIGLHEADATYDQNPIRGAQFYPSCIQLEVTGSGSESPAQNFNLNSGYSYQDPGIHFNLYQCPDPATGGTTYGCFGEYTAPGPEVWGA